MVGAAVHTTGVNWETVLANVASITVIIGAFGALVLRVLRRSIKDEIHSVIASDVTPILNGIRTEIRDHDTRIARMEGVEEGKRQAVAQTAVSQSGVVEQGRRRNKEDR